MRRFIGLVVAVGPQTKKGIRKKGYIKVENLLIQEFTKRESSLNSRDSAKINEANR